MSQKRKLVKRSYTLLDKHENQQGTMARVEVKEKFSDGTKPKPRYESLIINGQKWQELFGKNTYKKGKTAIQHFVKPEANKQYDFIGHRDVRELKEILKNWSIEDTLEDNPGRYSKTITPLHPNVIDASKSHLNNGTAVEDKIRQIYTTLFERQKKVFKTNIQFEYLLYDTNGKNFKDYYGSNNTNIFDTAQTITNRKELNEFLDRLLNKDLMKKYIESRPSSKYKFWNFVSFTIKIIPLDTPIGCFCISMPKYILTNPYIYSLNYGDNLCLFRCLVLREKIKNKVGNKRPKTDKLTNSAISLYEEYYLKKYDANDTSYNGVAFHELERFEEFFKVNIHIYELREKDAQAKLIRQTSKDFKDDLYVNAFYFCNQMHFSYINNIQKYTDNFKCCKCDKFFDTGKTLGRHNRETDCSTKKTKFLFEKGIFSITNNVFKRVKDMGIKIPKLPGTDYDDTFYDYFACYDFEAIQAIMKSSDKKLKLKTRHLPVSVSIYSNIPGYPVECLINENGNLDDFFDRFIKYLKKLSLAAYKIEQRKAENIPIHMINYCEEMDKYFRFLPVIGFNSGRYDMNMCKRYIFNALLENNEFDNFKVKQGNKYTCVGTSTLRFLDICSYLSPGTNYANFLKAYDCKEEKGFFPYDYLDSFKRLNETEFPSYESFWSQLKNKNIDKKDYDWLKTEIWEKQGMKTLKDLLIWYNNRDVVPFVEAVKKMVNIWKLEGIDMFRDAIGIPGLVKREMFNDLPGKVKQYCVEKNLPVPNEKDIFFCLFGEEEKEIYHDLRSNIVGGPSLVFNRYHEANITYIRNGKKLCKSVKGFDANALYLWALSQLMPTGECNKYIPKNKEDVIKAILSGTLFGFVKLNLTVPEHLKAKFAEMSPIFKNAKIEEKHLSEHMKPHAQKSNWKPGRKLIGSMFGKDILLLTPLVKWYIEHGLEVEDIKVVYEFKGIAVFQWFADEISDARRDADKFKGNIAKELLGEIAKLRGNSGYGWTVMNKEKHMTVKNFKDEAQLNKQLNNPLFNDINHLGNGTYEITKHKSKIKMDTPIQIGCAVYQYAKLRMLEFYYDFMDKYFSREDFEYIQMDTDSAYIAFSEVDIEKCVKPELREEYEEEKKKWFPQNSYDKRTPGLFKLEWAGDGMVALCSKLYFGWSESDKTKVSCKGTTLCKCEKDKCKCEKDNEVVNKDMFKSVLDSKESVNLVNRGFRSVGNEMYLYEQMKVALSYPYDKRPVLEDGRSTTYIEL